MLFEHQQLILQSYATYLVKLFDVKYLTIWLFL